MRTTEVGADWGEGHLLPQHAAILAASSIPLEMAQARGYRSVTTKAELRRLGFGDAQCQAPALLIRDELGCSLDDLYERVPSNSGHDGKPGRQRR